MLTLFHTHALPMLPLSPFLLPPPPQESLQCLDKYVKNAFSFDVIIVVDKTEN